MQEEEAENPGPKKGKDPPGKLSPAPREKVSKERAAEEAPPAKKTEGLLPV